MSHQRYLNENYYQILSRTAWLLWMVIVTVKTRCKITRKYFVMPSCFCIVNQDAKPLVVQITGVKFWNSPPPPVKAFWTQDAPTEELSILPDLFLGQGHWANHGYRVKTRSAVSIMELLYLSGKGEVLDVDCELLHYKGTELTIDRTELFDRTEYKSSFP